MKVLSFISALILTLVAFSVIAAEISANEYVIASEHSFEVSKRGMWDMVRRNKITLQEYNDTILKHDCLITQYVKSIKDKDSELSKKYGKAIIETNNELIKKLKVKNKQNLSDELRSAGSDVSLERSEVVYKKDFPWVKGVPVGAKVPALDALAASNVCQNKFASQNYNVSMK